ncbi:MAG: hypothetical protein CVU40_13845 [Chloroflexi bacterium HGW-Chloroflexi-2]|jgi:hypothetical protein|nr:MAG: hypothetical protein CVU40_13845 [Chloroflexi bacterium HGW-Chloroflexi-2]
MNKNLIIIGALINSLVCFTLAISSVPFDRLVTPTPTVHKTKIILPTLIPTQTPIPIPTVNPFQGEIYQEGLFDFIFDYPEAQALILDQEHTDLITDEGTRMFYVRFVNPDKNEGEIGSLRYSIVYYPEISEAITKYDQSYNLLTTGGEYALISETTILDGYPISLFLKTDDEGGYELRFLTRTNNSNFDTTGSIIISASSDRESTVGAFMELMNSLHFRVVDELSLF